MIKHHSMGKRTWQITLSTVLKSGKTFSLRIFILKDLQHSCYYEVFLEANSLKRFSLYFKTTGKWDFYRMFSLKKKICFAKGATIA